MSEQPDSNTPSGGGETPVPPPFGAPPAYGAPTPEPAPPTYGMPPPEPAPPGYGNPSGYGTPPPEPAPPGYGSSPGYGNPPGYGTPPSEPAPPGYGSSPGYGNPPGYGIPPAPYGTAPGSGYGYAPPPVPYGSSWMPTRSPESSSVRTQAIVAMILNIVSVVSCCNPLGIAGAITSGIAINRADTDVPAAKRLVAWGWGLLITSVVLAIAFVVVLFMIGTFADTNTSTTFNEPSY